MPTQVGPNILGEENLVFCYDLSDQKNSYLGEPTTNLANNTPLYGGWPSSYTLIDGATKTFDFTTSSVEWGGPAAWTTFYYNVSEYTGQYVTMSAVVESFDETSGVFSFMWIGQTVDDQVYLGYSPEEDRNTKTTKTRERISWSGVIGTGGKVGITIWMNNGTGGPSGSVKVRFSNLQVEVKSHPTPFTTGTRSVTQGLKDLTGNSTIDLTNVSFDDNAQMTFDGTDDFISIPHANSPIANLTYELVVKIDSIPASNTFRSIWQKSADWNGNTGISMQMIYGGLTFSYGNNWGGAVQYPLSNLTAGNRYHIVGTADSTSGTAVRFYINGVLVDTGTSYQIPTTNSNLTIGQGNGGTLDGKIDVFKMYSRELSASEILQNFNAIKGRYGL